MVKWTDVTQVIIHLTNIEGNFKVVNNSYRNPQCIESKAFWRST